MIVALLFALQSSPVPDLLARIDGRDPDACFGAIADLADLSAEYRDEIEKGAAKLPVFYRDALLAELRFPLPSPRRITLEGRRAMRGHLVELEQLSGLQFDLFTWELPLEVGTDLSFRNAHVMRALASLCAAKNVLIEKNGVSDRVIIRTLGKGRVWALGQRNLAVLHKHGGNQKWIDPARPTEWKARLDFNVVTGPGILYSGWKDIRVLEAVSEKGDDLRLDPSGEGPPMLDFPNSPSHHNWGTEEGFSVRVRLPEGVRTAARLKLSAVAKLITKYRSSEAVVKDGEGRGGSAKEGLEFDVRQIEPRSLKSPEFVLRLRAPDLTALELSQRRAVVEMTCSGHRGFAELYLKLVGEKEVVYEGRWKSTIGSVIDDDKATLERVIVRIPDGLEDWPVFAEFRDIPLR